ncbi:MAG: ATP-binding protein [Gammaproteobacteria bacterium]|nr:ATP-binding protein [Gammaproteobacteria bacterium]
MHLVPRSLSSRLGLVLLAVLVTAQLLSAWIMLRDRGQIMYETVRGDLVERTAGIVRLLDALPAAERRSLVPLLNTPETRVALAADALARDSGEEPAVDDAGRLAAALRERLPPGSEVRVSLRGGLATPPGPPAGMADMHRRHMEQMGGMAGSWAYLQGVPALARGYLIQVRLADGTWVRFERRLPESLFDRPTRLLLTLTILLASVVLLSLLAVRWVVRPLHRLRGAAEALGRDINRPPLAEAGPLEVAETARAFNTMQRRIRSFVEDRARILAAVSHDLKTPLTRLRLRAELLDDEALRDKVLADLNDMETMVAATLDFMRGAEAREDSRRVDLMALLETVAEDAREAGGRVSLGGTVNAPVAARPMALKRCLVNLVDNAVRYGGGAEITAGETPGAVRVVVADGGPGIPEALLEQAFEPFYRIDGSRARHTGGTGLGLGISRNIARAHGGDLILRNRQGGGLEAELTLPR